MNDIAPEIIVTPLAIDEFNGPVAELLMSPAGAFITGSTILINGGATASYFYGPLKPEEN